MEDEYGDVNEEELIYKFYMKNSELTQKSDEEVLDSIKTWVECFTKYSPETEKEKAELYENLMKSLFNILVENGRTPFFNN